MSLRLCIIILVYSEFFQRSSSTNRLEQCLLSTKLKTYFNQEFCNLGFIHLVDVISKLGKRIPCIWRYDQNVPHHFGNRVIPVNKYISFPPCRLEISCLKHKKDFYAEKSDWVLNNAVNRWIPVQKQANRW